MKPHIVCALAVLLWIGADAMAQGKGPGQGSATQVKENAPSPDKTPQGNRSVAGTGPKEAGKVDKNAPRPDRDSTAGGPKPGTPQGKNAQPPLNALEKGKSPGKEGIKHAEAFRKQLRHEDAKHLQRHARLLRIRELAAQKGDKEMVARVEKLMEKEQQLHGRKLQKFEEKSQATRQPPANVQPGAVPAAKPESGNRPQGAPDAKKPGGDLKPPK